MTAAIRFDRWNLRVVREGDRYGADDCLTHKDSRPMLEFYDATQSVRLFGLRGQFVNRFYFETLLDDESELRRRGLRLCGHVPAWDVTAAEMVEVFAYIKKES